MAGVFRAAGLGQMLDGEQLRSVGNLLDSTKRVHAFASDFSGRCSTLRRVKGQVLPMPQLAQAINRAVGPDGELNDDASEELTHIRRQKTSHRKRIEDAVTKLLHADSELKDYLQDDFFTVRSERYVVPMKLDGRGRVKGSIIDTSTSGQTLFIEPVQIQPMNDQLLELDLEEKLEIARIFRELSAKVAVEKDVLKANYEELTLLDFLSAQAQLAAEIHAGPVKLRSGPGIDLRDARHPLLFRNGGRAPIGNTIELKDEQSVLIISGPNAGGKTVVLKTVGLLHLMAKAGLLLPAEPTSEVYLYDQIYLEMGDAQNLSANLSTFSGHLMGLKPILERAGGNDLTLLDELAVGTDPETGAAIGTAVLEDLAQKRVTSLVTTHYDALKGLAVSDGRFRNGSMEYSLGSLKPTYKLILDIPGQSYGIEVAEQIGLKTSVLARAKELRGGKSTSLDLAVSELMRAREDSRNATEALDKERLAAEAEKSRWQQEVELLNQQRRKTALQLSEKYEAQVTTLRQEYEELVKKLRTTVKDVEQGKGTASREDLLEGRKNVEKALKGMEGVVSELAGYDPGEKLPGRAAGREELGPNVPVYVLPLKKAGKVVRLGSGSDESIEVEVGIIKLRVNLHDLRILSAGEVPGSSEKKKAKPFVTGKSAGGPAHITPRGNTEIGLVIQTPLNSIDLRGRDSDDAVEAAWNFIDRSLLRGEESVILIHGHGEGTLKARLRDALRNNCPYDVRFRAGLDQEGGDGVTVVRLKN